METAQRAILNEALKKGALVWVELADHGHARWHAWTGDRIYLLTGPGEQPDPGLASAAQARIVVRSKDNRHRLISFGADVSRLHPEDADWDAATAELARLRLNLSDAEHAPERWASDDFAIFRLVPILPLMDDVGDVPSESHRAPPVPTDATTAGRRPFVLHRRGGSGRPLS